MRHKNSWRPILSRLAVGLTSGVFCGALLGAPPADVKATGRSMSGFHIGVGDILEVHVWKEAEASVPQVVVRSDGKISLPIVKEVEVLGLTPSQLEKILVEKYARFIHDPEVTVLVKQINSEKVYLVGALRKPGSIPLQASMTVLQALAEGGGFTEFAKKNKIYVLRSEDGKQVRYPFNYDSVVRGEHLEQNFQVIAGDTIVVP